jgi:hypothetical protein
MVTAVAAVAGAAPPAYVAAHRAVPPNSTQTDDRNAYATDAIRTRPRLVTGSRSRSSS